MLHHYTNYIAEDMLRESSDQVRHLVEEYASIDKNSVTLTSTKLTPGSGSTEDHVRKRLVPI
jgi:hypothetical protein